jgi:opacity protein-like surface antigen
MKFQIKRCSTIIALNLLVVIMTSAVYAGDGDYVKDGFYIGVSSIKTHLSGDFKGIHYYDAIGEILVVPDMDNDTGFGFVLGGRGAGLALELGYQRSIHETTSGWADPFYIDEGPVFFDESEASYNAIDFNLKVDVFAQKRIRPYVLLGIGYSWLTIENGLFDYTDDLWSVEPNDEDELKGSFDDAFFDAFHLNFGCGVAYYFHPQWAVTAGLMYQRNRFDSWDISLDDTLSEEAFCLSVGIAYTF